MVPAFAPSALGWRGVVTTPASDALLSSSRTAPPRSPRRVSVQSMDATDNEPEAPPSAEVAVVPAKPSPMAQSGLTDLGEAWVVAQGALLLLIATAPFPGLDILIRLVAGPGLTLGGAALIARSVKDLGLDSLSPWPKPLEGGALSRNGVYGAARHPMYGGVLLSVAGLALWTLSPQRVALAVALFFVFRKKIDVEEALLRQYFGEEYDEYAKDVPWKLLYKVW